MTFKEFNTKIQEQFNKMQQYPLFRVAVSGHELWDTYLEGFTREEDPIFRDPKSTTHTCNNDCAFIRRYGNIVAIDDNYNLMSMFDIEVDYPYINTVNALKDKIHGSKVSEIFIETFAELNSLPYASISKKDEKFQLGHEKTLKRYDEQEAYAHGVTWIKPGDVIEFNHFHVFADKRFIDQSGKSVEAIMGAYRTNKQVFERGMVEIPLDTLELVKDLIQQGSLLNGEAHLPAIKALIKLKKNYNGLTENQDNWLWANTSQPFAQARNTMIGNLCVELAEGKELNAACESYNKMADPVNYKKAKAPITKSMIEAAQKFLDENGYTDAFSSRKFAVIDDININDIKHRHDGTDAIEKPAGLFAGVKPSASTRHKRSEFDGVQEVSIEKFMSEILTSATGIEIYFENKHQNNLVSLITGSTGIFSWNNPFSWTYRNNLTGVSQIKEAVKKAGGIVDGVLNFRSAWNHSGTDQSDLDAWAKEPDGNEIGYSTSYRKDRGNVRSNCSGQLDVDNTNPGNKMGVENITWTIKSKMKEGTYRLWINQFSNRNSQGFEAEIELEGETYTYLYNQPVNGRVKVADVTYSKKDGFSIHHHIQPTQANQTIWNIETNQFHKVNLVCLSPNYWGDNNVGNKHYFFMMDKCKSTEPLRSFHNEFLKSDLRDHRKVLEVLASTTMLAPAKEQLCGLGFNATVKDSVIVKVKGTHQRIIKITF